MTTEDTAQAMEKARKFRKRHDIKMSFWGTETPRARWMVEIVEILDSYESLYAENKRYREALETIKFGAGEQTEDEADYEEFETYYNALARCYSISQQALHPPTQ